MQDLVTIFVPPRSNLSQLPLLAVLVVEVLVDVVTFLRVVCLLGELEGQLLAWVDDWLLLLVGVRALRIFQRLSQTEVGAACQHRGGGLLIVFL